MFLALFHSFPLQDHDTCISVTEVQEAFDVHADSEELTEQVCDCRWHVCTPVAFCTLLLRCHQIIQTHAHFLILAESQGMLVKVRCETSEGGDIASHSGSQPVSQPAMNAGRPRPTKVFKHHPLK